MFAAATIDTLVLLIFLYDRDEWGQGEPHPLLYSSLVFLHCNDGTITWLLEKIGLTWIIGWLTLLACFILCSFASPIGNCEVLSCSWWQWLTCSGVPHGVAFWLGEDSCGVWKSFSMMLFSLFVYCHIPIIQATPVNLSSVNVNSTAIIDVIVLELCHIWFQLVCAWNTSEHESFSV